jgi:hypothetical protein
MRAHLADPAIDNDALDEAAQLALVELMRPGTIILQTPERAAIQRDLTSTPPSSLTPNSLSLFAFMITSQRAKHWLHGAYLIVSRGDGDGTDASDSLVAVNLTRIGTLGTHLPPRDIT